MKSFIQSKFLLVFCLSLTICISESFSNTMNGITVNARVYLQGALLNSVDVGETHGRALMRDNLRKCPFNGQRLIPNADIYQTPLVVNNYITTDVTGQFNHVACGGYPEYKLINDPFTVFAVSGENAIVDWIFVELRDKNDYKSVIATRSGLVQRDGDVVDLDGTSALFFPDVNVDSYFVVLRHRNHLGVMTKYPMTPEQMVELLDFTTYDLGVFDFANTNGEFNYSGLAMKIMTVNGLEVRALWGGDFDGDGKICYQGKNDDLSVIHKEVAAFDMSLNPLFKLDFDLAVGYLQGDFDMNGKTKFDNPNDDKNYLFEQILIYSENTKVIANFAHFIEQIPN